MSVLVFDGQSDSRQMQANMQEKRARLGSEDDYLTFRLGSKLLRLMEFWTA